MQTWPDVIGHSAEVLADHTRVARLFKHCAKILLPFAPVRFAIVRAQIITGMKMRLAAAGSLEHLVPFERKKFSVLLRTPGKSVDAIEPQNVVDAEKMKTAPNAANTLSPPIEISMTHYLPMKKRNPPVLSPLLGEFVVLEVGF